MKKHFKIYSLSHLLTLYGFIVLTLPTRDPDGQSMSDIQSCESPDQISYWGGILVNGPVWPDSPEQSQKTTSAKVMSFLHSF